jgi:hypothetical protein
MHVWESTKICILEIARVVVWTQPGLARKAGIANGFEEPARLIASKELSKPGLWIVTVFLVTATSALYACNR